MDPELHDAPMDWLSFCVWMCIIIGAFTGAVLLVEMFRSILFPARDMTNALVVFGLSWFGFMICLAIGVLRRGR